MLYKLKKKNDLIIGELKNKKGLTFKFLESGAILTIEHENIMINQILGNPIDGGIGNIFIRIHQEDEILYFPIMGPSSKSIFALGEDCASWIGTTYELDYICRLQLAEETTDWYFTISIENKSDDMKMIDAIYTQDIGIANENMIRSNELYTSQYIDHQVFEDKDYGYIICSRQNQPQDNEFPWLMSGCFNKSVGYLTDGYQFYGLGYKETNVPVALTEKQLTNERYQYEFALPTLQTERRELSPCKKEEITFFSSYLSNHQKATSIKDLDKIDSIAKGYKRLSDSSFDNKNMSSKNIVPSLFNTSNVFCSEDLTEDELSHLFSKERRHVEKRDGTVLSFFYNKRNHVVLKAKDVITERAHAHIMRSGSYSVPNDNILSVTSWMYGIFSSHVTIGNTNFNKMLTLSRNGLNVMKSSGQRVFVKTKQGYKLLGMPSAFEMGFNYARWIYKGEGTMICVRVWTSLKDSACFMDIRADHGEEFEFLISNNVMAGNMEYETEGQVIIHDSKTMVELVPSADEQITHKYPGAKFFIVSKDSDKIETLGGDQLLFNDEKQRHLPYVVVKTKPVNNFSMAFTGSVLSKYKTEALAEKYSKEIYTFEEMLVAEDDYYNTLSNQAVVASSTKSEEIMKFNDLIPWYIHNAMIHYTTPHGLEQYSGAAWGLRDVCQGPTELLLATKHYDVLREVIKMIYAYQILQTGDWRQWFMIDRFYEIQDANSHNDIIIWPIKALCDYIEATNDLSILDEKVKFIDETTHKFTEESATIFEHTLMQIRKIENDCISGTALIRYGHGDWEDTLQPANAKLRDNLVSTWTVELVYQNLMRYKTVCQLTGHYEIEKRLEDFCKQLKEDFEHYLIKDNIVAGLAYFKADEVEYMLHPRDEKTGIKYRLIPMNRGIISEIFSKEQAKEHLSIMENHLLFPDGARLMNSPMMYHGGTETFFKRAETGANFGREIGLQYIHAHIRYLEAMAKLGEAESLYKGLQTINHIKIDDMIPLAMPRQSNCYFSSSDANFLDRYKAVANFDDIKKNKVGIKGGWRIYSSGPGIYLAQLMLNFLGIKEYFSDVYLDPVIPKHLDGLTFDFKYKQKKVRYVYHITKREYSPYKLIINGQELDAEVRYADNPYRRGGILINREKFENALNMDENTVEIYM